MNSIIVKISVVIIFLFSFTGCEESIEPDASAAAKPTIKKTSVNYTHETIQNCLPDSTSHHCMNRAFSNNYSSEIKEKINSYIKDEVNKLGEDVGIIDNILSRTGCNNYNEFILPSYLERAKYENREAWLIQVIYGLGSPNFGHYRCFAFDINNLDTLFYVGCR